MLRYDLRHTNQMITADTVEVEPEKLRRLIGRVVFLSVPHSGTNIADWVEAH